ncbi:43435_t:CDS:2 [Gigaspora margarita]|uniref:43435_t:CDS:1 n=1 Tax=Gigaspora margarita TaxID=4874 RepID=A0ABN7UJ22_GIGMA|nr:43435_t:CDS:2 [Gigaspora margarita]
MNLCNKEQIQFLQRENKQIRKISKENGISRENLEMKLRKLENITKEKIQFKEEIQQLQLQEVIQQSKQETQQLLSELEYKR